MGEAEEEEERRDEGDLAGANSVIVEEQYWRGVEQGMEGEKKKQKLSISAA